MDIRDYVTPKTVTVTLAVGLLITLLATPFTPTEYRSTLWDRYMDLVVILSLLVTITVLSDLNEIQQRYLLRATITDLQEDLEQRANTLGDLLRSDSRESEAKIDKELSKESGILKNIADRSEGVNEDVHREATSLRENIRTYTTSPQGGEDEVYDIWKETHTLNELVKGLIEESKWKR
jgi:ElaB/YqjD/DUF883 family membrane-anchored ribosome-binding protein